MWPMGPCCDGVGMVAASVLACPHRIRICPIYVNKGWAQALVVHREQQRLREMLLPTGSWPLL